VVEAVLDGRSFDRKPTSRDRRARRPTRGGGDWSIVKQGWPETYESHAASMADLEKSSDVFFRDHLVLTLRESIAIDIARLSLESSSKEIIFNTVVQGEDAINSEKSRYSDTDVTIVFGKTLLCLLGILFFVGTLLQGSGVFLIPALFAFLFTSIDFFKTLRRWRTAG
jgi:hypothetical protein